MKKAAFILAAVLFGAVFFVVALIVESEFPFAYMDLNDDGFVSPFEAVRSLDLGVREVRIDGRDCQEVFALKDGHPIKQICPKA